MASSSCSLSEDQFRCPICLEVFRDPVSAPCGHTFCKTCLNQSWSPGASCSCPCCRRIFYPRPELQVNVFVAEMTTQFRRSQSRVCRSSEEAAEDGEVLCDLCTGPRRRALKSCLVCLSSFCESHLEPHRNISGLRRHQLLEPLRDLEKRVCAEHDKPLELFCSSDRLCVCVLCVHSKHKNHQVLPLKEASDLQRLQLQDTDDQLQDRITRRMKKMEELREVVRVSDAAAVEQVSEGVKVFTPLMKIVESSLDLLISEVTQKKTDVGQQAEVLIQELEQEIQELQESAAEVKLLSQSDDPLHLLLTSSQLRPEPPTKDWTSVNLSAPQYEGSVRRALSKLEQHLSQKIKGLCEQDLKTDTTRESSPLRTLQNTPRNSNRNIKHTSKKDETVIYKSLEEALRLDPMIIRAPPRRLARRSAPRQQQDDLTAPPLFSYPSPLPPSLPPPQPFPPFTPRPYPLLPPQLRLDQSPSSAPPPAPVLPSLHTPQSPPPYSRFFH